MMDLRTTVVGNLTDEPELRFTAQGTAVCRVTIAHNPRTRDAASGEWKDGEPTFLTGTAWRQLAENVAESLAKGARVIATGRLRTERWETNGEKRSRVVLDIEGIGPDLSYATAQVKKMIRNGGDPNDPWSTASRTRPSAPSSDTAPAGPTGDDSWAGDEPPF